jgi:hypothetical protein
MDPCIFFGRLFPPVRRVYCQGYGCSYHGDEWGAGGRSVSGLRHGTRWR